MAISATISKVKAYSIPLLLFSASLFFQLVLIPRSFPPSHYDVLGIKRYSSMEEVKKAYRDLSSKWNTGIGDSSILDMIKIQYAYELLVDPIWKRDYDIFGIDEQVEVIEKVQEQFAGARFSDIDLPLLESHSFDMNEAPDVISSENLLTKLNNSSALLVQVFSTGSKHCAQFYSQWKRIVNLLDGIANTGMVEIGDVKLAAYLAEKKYTGELFFRSGLPSLVAFPPSCKALNCLVRYTGELSVDAVTDWFATTILNLPRIPYYSKESLGQSFLGKGGWHKVKVIFISKTGQRATPFVRHTAKSYWYYASYAFAVWREDEYSFWANTFGVEDAPAIVFLRDPGVKPVVYHGLIDNSRLIDVMEQNKHQVLPQLRSVTSMELGCDAKGYSRAGNDSTVWYCAVLVGRHSSELQKMRETMRRVQEMLLDDGLVNTPDQHQSVVAAAVALKEKRLTFSWLDGEAQKKYCLFYVNVEDSYETCGPRRAMTDVPRLFIVRYKRNDTEVIKTSERNAMNMFASIATGDVDPTSQLVALYKGLDEAPQIIQWISEIIRDGDSRDLPFHRTRTPELVPEDADPIWSRSTEKIRSSSRGMKISLGNIIQRMYDIKGDPRVGPMLLLAALMSFGGIFLRRSQAAKPEVANCSSQSSAEDDAKSKTRRPPKRQSNRGQPPSITDFEPRGAVQMEFSDNDSE